MELKRLVLFLISLIYNATKSNNNFDLYSDVINLHY